MNKIAKVIGIIGGLTFVLLGGTGLYWIIAGFVYFVDIFFVFRWAMALLLVFFSGWYLVLYCYKRYAKNVNLGFIKNIKTGKGAM